MIDLNKPLQTRDGRKVKILSVDSDPLNGQPLRVWVWGWSGAPHGGREEYSLDGRYDFSKSGWDLVNVEPKSVRRWVNIYSEDGTLRPGRCIFDSREEAEEVGRCHGCRRESIYSQTIRIKLKL